MFNSNVVRSFFLKNISLFLMAMLISHSNALAQTAPPVAAKKPKTDVLHGDTRVDDYFWLREKANPEVVSYLKAENAYAEQMLATTKPLQEELYKEMLGRIKQTDLSVPYRFGEYYYYSRTEQGKQYPIQCRKKGSLEAAEEITLDLNKMAEGKTFMGLGAYEVSDDGNLLAFSSDSTGFRVYNLQIKNLRTGDGAVLQGRGEKGPPARPERHQGRG